MLKKLLSFVFLEKLHWKHFFGGLSFLILILQLITGIFLILFYDPALNNAYRSVQYLTNKLTGGSIIRNLHRWVAFSLFITIFVHTIRSALRWDFINTSKRFLWLTGALLLLPIFLLVTTGVILPWEWKGYWFMEMIPNYSELFPFIGTNLKSFFIQSFTLPRYQVIHILILPIISLILIDYHFLDRLRKRGVFIYILRHTVISLPFFILLFAAAGYFTIPSEDPEIVPLPLEGEYIPAPEWYFIILLLPLMYFKNNWIPILTIYLPILLFIAIVFLPYYLKYKKGEGREEGYNNYNSGIGVFKKVIRSVVVILSLGIFIFLMYLGTYNSPTFGCNSCHNTSRGERMGVPPAVFKDRNALPNLNDNQWMMGHWFYPNIIW